MKVLVSDVSFIFTNLSVYFHYSVLSARLQKEYLNLSDHKRKIASDKSYFCAPVSVTVLIFP